MMKVNDHIISFNKLIKCEHEIFEELIEIKIGRNSTGIDRDDFPPIRIITDNFKDSMT